MSRDVVTTDSVTALGLRDDDTTESSTAPVLRDADITDRVTALGLRDDNTTESNTVSIWEFFGRKRTFFHKKILPNSLYSVFGVLDASQSMKLKLEFVPFKLVRLEIKI